MKRVYIIYASNRPPDKSVNIFFYIYFSSKTYVVGTQRNRHNETKTAVKTDGPVMGKKILNFFYLKALLI